MKNIYFLAGSTKAGKSTLTNYLLNYPLQEDPKSINGEIVAKEYKPGMAPIGNSSLSETPFPQIYSNK